MTPRNGYHSAKRLALGIYARLLFRFQLRESRSLPERLEDLVDDLPVHPLVPTYDGSGQAVHPDVFELPGASASFLLAMTPYTFTDDYLENPSILASNDGLRFHEEAQGLNPLAPPPPFDHNDDPDLSLEGGTYTILYLETLRPKKQNLVRLRSEDRLSWRRDVLLSYSLEGPRPEPLIVSPAQAKAGARAFLYYVNTSSSPYRIEYLEAETPEAWDKALARLPSFDRLSFVPWHLDIVEGGEYFYMLLTEVFPLAAGRSFDLHVARSRDLVNWELGSRVFAQKPFGCRSLYRASALGRGGELFVYFSYESGSGQWRIGLVRKSLEALFPSSPHEGRA